MEKTELQTVAFNIITKVGEARSTIFQAIGDLADKKIEMPEFNQMLEKASKDLTSAGQEHLSVIQKEAEGVDIQHTLLLTHAEDLYLTTSTLLELTIRMVKLFKIN